MNKKEECLLVPINLEALVIEDREDPGTKGILMGAQPRADGRSGDLKWSPRRADYTPVARQLDPPGPEPFYGATSANDVSAVQGDVLPFTPLILKEEARPRLSDQGVYLHWTLPPALRRSVKPNALEFRPIPDQWLIVRFARKTSTLTEVPEVRAWFMDGSAEADDSKSSGPANLLRPDPKERDWGTSYIGQRVGRVSRLEQVAPSTETVPRRARLTALGNEYTGSPTFSAFMAENRDVLSWHDDLADLRDKGHLVPEDTTLTYLVVGWHEDPKNDPLAGLEVKTPVSADLLLRLQSLLSGLDWQCDAVPDELPAARCLYHATLARIHYWNPRTYRGPLLGYPNAPLAHGGLKPNADHSIALAIGNTAEDALVALAGSKAEGEGTKTLWKALEAVIYRQTETLLGEAPERDGWKDEGRERRVHQNGFASQEAGTVWSISPREQSTASGPSSPPPTPEQLESLRALNQAQAQVDALTRELAARQHELYAAWWAVCRGDALEDSSNESACQLLLGEVTTLQKALSGPVTAVLGARKAELESLLTHTSLEPRAEAAPRFWRPVDPVIVIQNLGEATSRSFPKPLPCRLSSATASQAEVRVGMDRQHTHTAGLDSGIASLPGVDPLKCFGPLARWLTALTQEAALVEQAVMYLAAGTLPVSRREGYTQLGLEEWRHWSASLASSFDEEPHSTASISLFQETGSRVATGCGFKVWIQQPWCPLFLDWRITWHPAAPHDPGYAFNGRDYHPADKKWVKSEGQVASGRSLLTFISGDFFSEPLAQLRKLLERTDTSEESGSPRDRDLKRELADFTGWATSLRQLEDAKLVGQSVTGLHQRFLGRDVTRPRVRPNGVHPWNLSKKKLEHAVQQALEAPRLNNVPPPILLPDHAPPGRDARQRIVNAPEDIHFNLYRSGWFTLDQLWVVDEFGQWADVVGGAVSSPSMALRIHPRLGYPGDDTRARIAMPPRIVQPTRLKFDTVPAASSGEQPTNPICGWIYPHPLDQALAVCDPNGRLLGELVSSQGNGNERYVRWESLASPQSIEAEQIPFPDLGAFVLGLMEEEVVGTTRLDRLLDLIQAAPKPAAGSGAPRGLGPGEQPLALVKAQVGLELFGQPWQDWRLRSGGGEAPSGGGFTKTSYRAPVVLGDTDDDQNGLIGYYRPWGPEATAPTFDRIVPAPIPTRVGGGYIADPLRDAPLVGFDDQVPLLLLLDPRGSVLASTGLLPATPLRLEPGHAESSLSRMEVSFRVGPLLMHPGTGALPVPVSPESEWFLQEPRSAAQPQAVAPLEPSPRLDSVTQVAIEGRLVRRQLVQPPGVSSRTRK